VLECENGAFRRLETFLTINQGGAEGKRNTPGNASSRQTRVGLPPKAARGERELPKRKPIFTPPSLKTPCFPTFLKNSHQPSGATIQRGTSANLTLFTRLKASLPSQMSVTDAVENYDS